MDIAITTFLFIFVFLSLCYFGTILWFTYGWFLTPSFKRKNTSPTTKVSIIIPARNEQKNIVTCLNALRRQNYPSELFEVIVIDDHSTDNTYARATAFDLPNLRVIQLIGQNKPIGHSYKKEAIEVAVHQATGELMITTDADCTMGAEWLASIVAYYEKYQPNMIAGPVSFTGGNNLLQHWQHMDMAGMMGITAGAIYNNMPVMCNGANLAYPKKVFQAVNGYQGFYQQPSGDDILLMLKIKQHYPGGITFLKSPDALVKTDAPASFKAFFSQRMRWLSKSTQFGDWRITAVLVLAYLFNLAVLTLSIAGLFMDMRITWWALSLFAFKFLLELPLLWSAYRFYNRSFPWLFFPVAQVFHLFYVLIAGLLARNVSYSWKGRTYR